MATPDPNMDELLIMAYEGRPRACRAKYCVPRRSDFIEVLWCLDNIPGQPNKWCTAEVLYVEASSEHPSLAKGIILYMPGETWDRSAHTVEFLENYKLRRVEEGDEDTSESERDEVPELEWRFSSHSKQESGDGDEEWNESEDNKAGLKNKSLRRVSHSQLQDQYEIEIKSLRNGHASLAVEVEKLKRELVKHSHRLVQLQTKHLQPSCSSAACVLSRLRYRLALKIQTGLRAVSSTLGKRSSTESEQNVSIHTGDGLHLGAIKARVECTLLQFEGIARQVRSSSSPQSVYFFPEFSQTQLPLQCSARFRILFSTFAELIEHVGVTSVADRMEMVRKCGSGPQGDLLRVLATYSFSKGNKMSSARIYPGTSCGDVDMNNCAGINHENQKDADGINGIAPQLYPILIRKTREWHKVDRRFVHCLRTQRVQLPKLSESASELEEFALSWQRGPNVGSRVWARSLSEAREVFGYLEVTIPFIQTQGTYLCTELGGLATDEIWTELVRNRLIDST